MNLLDLFENTNQPQGVAEGVDVFYNAGETANKKPVGKGTKVKSKITGKVGKAYSWSVVKGVPYLHVKSDDDRYQSPAKDWLVLDEQGVSEGHADQQKTIVKRNGQPVGEVGIDRESSPGAGMYYMKHYASGLDLGGYDSREEALDELRYAIKQGVSEAMKPSDIPPSMRQRLTMRDIEAERPQGAFRFRVITPQGDQIDFMEGLVRPSELRPRMLVWAEEEMKAARLPLKSSQLLEAILYRGELPKGDAETLLGVSERTARRSYTALIERGALTSESRQAPLRLAFPAALATRWMPGLFPDKRQSD